MPDARLQPVSTPEPRAAPAVTGFIVGMSRAGTRWLSSALHRHSQAAVFGESAFWGRHYVPPGPDGRYDAAGLKRLRGTVGTANMHSTPVNVSGGGVPALFQRVVDAFEASGHAPTPREVFGALGGAVGVAEGKTHVIEKTPHHVNWLGRIRAAYPEARFVVMMREPYGFMRSYKHQGDRKPDEVRDRFADRYHPAACALVYRRSLTSALDALGAPDVHRVDFERVRSAPEAVLAEVQAFLGLDVADLPAPPSNTSFPGGARPELDPVDVFWMNRIAGGVIRRAGYPMRASGARVGAIARSLPGLTRLGGQTDGLSLGYLLRWFR